MGTCAAQHLHVRWRDAESVARARKYYLMCMCTRRRKIRLVVMSHSPSSQLWRPRDSKRHSGYFRHVGLEFIPCELNWVHLMQQPWLHSWLLFVLVVSLHCTDQWFLFGRVGVQSSAFRFCFVRQGGALQSAYVDGHRICIY